MATLIADNNQASRVDEPRAMISPADQHGRVRRAYDKITLAAELTAADTIQFMKLPKGATLISAKLIMPTSGTDGIMTVGWESNGTDAADADGIFLAQDFGAGAIDSDMAGIVEGYNKKFAEETQINATVTETSVGSIGDLIQLELLYIVD